LSTRTGDGPKQSQTDQPLRGRVHKISVLTFVAVVVLCLIALIQLQQAPRGPDVFASANPTRLLLLGVLPAEDVLELKLRHASTTPRYDVGLFGNSRILGLGVVIAT
jgi:hypothetical protein